MQKQSAEDSEMIYEVVIKICSKGLNPDLALSLEIFPTGSELQFEGSGFLPGKAPSALMAADEIIKFIESGMAQPGLEPKVSTEKMVVN